MDLNFNRDQWAIVLGGSSGFGLATAQKLADYGISVVLTKRNTTAMQCYQWISISTRQ